MVILHKVREPVNETVLIQLTTHWFFIYGTNPDDSDVVILNSFFGEHVSEKSW